MLVLTRKKGERVMIGDDIVVTIIDVRGDGVRIGFDAPRGIAIQRAEVLSAVTEANTAAASTTAANADMLVGLLSKAKPKTPVVVPAEAGEAAAADASATSAPAVPAGSAVRPKPRPRKG